MKELERSLGAVSVIAISMSSMLGSGIFVLPGLAAAKTGPSVWLAYVLAGLCVFPAAACKAELATAMPTSGGTYVYIDRIFGPLAGTVAGMALWLSMLMKSAFALVGFGTYLIALSDLPVKPTASVLLVAIMAAGVFANAIFAIPGSLSTFVITNSDADPALAFYGVAAAMLAISALMLHRRRTLPEGLYDEMLRKRPAD